MAGWPGPQSPSDDPEADDNYRNMTQVCGRTPATGCLYNVFEDPSERNNLASANPEVYSSMLARVRELNQTIFSPTRGESDGAACAKAVANGGYW